MITNKTVFILGAGASVPFGFPTGADLFNKIVADLSNTQNAFHGVLRESGIELEELITLRNRLKYSGQSSVDAFLEHNPELLNVGKAAISAALIPFEKVDSLFTIEHNWYRYILDAMSCDFDSFDKNQVSFITYNYDRSLEHFFATALANTHRKEIYECAIKVKGIPIVHLHGVLGNYPFFGESSRDYLPRIDKDVVAVAASKIRIVHESVENYPEFTQAHNLLREARIICFLGFGYNSTNLKRLWNPDFIKGRSVNVFATAFGLGESQRNEVISYFKTEQMAQTIEVGGSGEQILEFLRNKPVVSFLRRI